MSCAFSFFILISSLLPGTLALLTLNAVHKNSGSENARVGRAEGVVILVLGAVAEVFALLRQPHPFIGAFAGGVCIWMLLVTASMDRKSGYFAVLPLAVALPAELITDVVYCIAAGEVMPVRGILLVVGILTVLGLSGLAVGDCVIYTICYLAFIPLCGEYTVLAFGTMVLAASILALVCRGIGMIRKRRVGDLKERFPFTASIAFGAYAAIFLFAYLGR